MAEQPEEIAEVMSLEAAQASVRTQRRRRLMLAFAVPAIVVGAVIGAARIRIGGGQSATTVPPAARDWNTGMKMLEEGRTSKAIAVLETAVHDFAPGSERTAAHVQLAGIYRTLGETQAHYLNSAIRHYLSALDAADGAVATDEVLYRIGICFFRLGSHETALQFFERLEAEFPSSVFVPEARYEKGECYLAIGRYQAAREVLSEVVQTCRGDPLGEKAFFRLADSFDEQAQSLKKE